MAIVTLPARFANAPTKGSDVTQDMVDLYNIVQDINNNAAPVSGGALSGTSLTVTGTSTFSDVAALTANSATAALTVTQTGSGNSLVIEDSASPDSTPFIVDTSGNLVTGTTAVIATGPIAATPRIQMHGTSNNGSGLGLYDWSSTASGTPSVQFLRSLSGTVGTRAQVATIGTSIGMVSWGADGGTNFNESARIENALDAASTATSAPGRVVISTTAPGGTTVTERVRIDSGGSVGIGATALSASGINFRISRAVTGVTTSYSVYNDPTVQSDVTSSARLFQTVGKTQAASFTLGNMIHFYASQGTFGAGSTVTSQYGFYAENNLTGATNNYGYYSNIASGSNIWNFYGNGTARSLLNGDLTVFGGTAVPAGGTAGTGIMMSSTANLGIFFGSNTPTLSAAQGSLYIRTDGSSSSTRLYVNTNGSTGWTNVTTAA